MYAIAFKIQAFSIHIHDFMVYKIYGNYSIVPFHTTVRDVLQNLTVSTLAAVTHSARHSRQQQFLNHSLLLGPAEKTSTHVLTFLL